MPCDQVLVLWDIVIPLERGTNICNVVMQEALHSSPFIGDPDLWIRPQRNDWIRLSVLHAVIIVKRWWPPAKRVWDPAIVNARERMC